MFGFHLCVALIVYLFFTVTLVDIKQSLDRIEWKFCRRPEPPGPMLLEHIKMEEQLIKTRKQATTGGGGGVNITKNNSFPN